MECCKKGSKHPVEITHPDGGEFGLVSKRSCRDVPCLIVFVAFLCGLCVLGYFAVSKGDVDRLLNGVDSWGNVCGKKNRQIPEVSLSGRNFEKKTKLFFFDPTYFLSKLPRLPSTSLTKATTVMVCVERCPDNETNSVMDFYNTEGINLCRYDVTPYVNDRAKCPQSPVPKHKSFFNRCIPQTLIDTANKVTTTFTSTLSNIGMGEKFTEKCISDFKATWPVIGALMGIAVVVALLVVVMMKVLAAVIVWTLVISVALLSLGAAGYCWYTWVKLDLSFKALSQTQQTPEAQQAVTTWLVYACVVTVIAMILILILLVTRKRIKLVAELFNEAGRAIGSIPLLLLQPVWTLLALFMMLGVLGLLACYIETSGPPYINPTSGHVTYKMELLWKYFRWANIFAVLWLAAFIVACQDLVIAGAVARWYFTRDKGKLGWPILDSIKTMMRYHLGSLALGSFIIAVVQMARLILSYIQCRLRGRVSKVAEFIMKCLQCCLWCFERFLKFLNRNAYIVIAIYGDSFCSSARKAFTILLSNALRVAAINSIGDFVLFLGKLLTVGVVLLIGNEVFLKSRTDVNYVWVPLSLACLYAYCIAHCFLLVYEITIDTIFLCFCEDSEKNDGIIRPYFMSKNLMKLLSGTSIAMNQTGNNNTDVGAADDHEDDVDKFTGTTADEKHIDKQVVGAPDIPNTDGRGETGGTPAQRSHGQCSVHSSAGKVNSPDEVVNSHDEVVNSHDDKVVNDCKVVNSHDNKVVNLGGKEHSPVGKETKPKDKYMLTVYNFEDGIQV